MSVRTRLCLAGCAMAALLSGHAAAAAATPTLEDGFRNPPQSARPRVWWHWMNGNVTKDGIRLDLEWMKRAGIGGFQNFDASMMTPKLVEHRLVFMTPEWKDAFHYAIGMADQLGLEAAIAGSPGWSESGGPWVKPEQAMKKYVWSETTVEGGRRLAAPLPAPPANAGPFLDAPVADFPGEGPPKPIPDLYRDAAVVAFPARPATPAPTITSSSGAIDAALLSDGKVGKAVELVPGDGGQPAWIAFDYAAPTRISAFTLALANPDPSPFSGPGTSPAAILQVSDDGAAWRDVASIVHGGAPEHTVGFAPVTGRHFRMAFPTLPRPDLPSFFEAMVPKGPPRHRIAELVLHADARVNRFEDKAAFSTLSNLEALPTASATDADAVAQGRVIDLTSKLRPDGTLDWTPPKGRWTILRIGWSLTGITNHPAAVEVTGPEVDKLNAKDVHDYAEAYLAQYQDAAGPGLMGRRGLQYMVNDSWEAGAQNWTDDILAQFAKRRGYDPHPYLPVLAGHVVGSAAASDGFLWDFRQTIGELTVDNHYEELNRVLHAHGMGHYGESHESGRALIADGMDVKRGLDVPMSAMWVGPEPQQAGGDADIRESASVAHIYGQNLVAAESLTTMDMQRAWGFSPEMLKATADRELSDGLNRFVIHTSVHQPLTDKAPGVGLGPFGQWFTRNETWAEQAHAFTDYLSRSAYMLQQGRFVADVAWFYGEDSNITALYSGAPPPVPAGYPFDYVNAHVITDVLAVKDGRLITPSGMSYRVLALDPRTRLMSLEVLSHIRDLAAAGALVVGARPVASPSAADDPAAFKAVADEVWGSGAGDHPLGVGRVTTAPLADVLADMSTPDVIFDKAGADADLRFVHRTLPDGEIYFVLNRRQRPEPVEASFRTTGLSPEIWRAETGQAQDVSYHFDGRRTVVPLDLASGEALFVVFRHPGKGPSLNIAPPAVIAQGAVTGPWKVSFQPGRGAPAAAITLDHLGSLTDRADPGVKYFSGVATYTTTLQASAGWFAPGARQILDLGEVANVAEVTVNGHPVGIAWKHPFRLDATGALKPGPNQVEIKVADLWPNRMIGDKQPGATPVAFATFDPYTRDSPLRPSGLIGPVQVEVETGAAAAPVGPKP